MRTIPLLITIMLSIVKDLFSVQITELTFTMITTTPSESNPAIDVSASGN